MGLQQFINIMLMVTTFVVICGAALTPAESAAVQDNDKQQAQTAQLGETHGECDDGRVVNCRTLPLFNYTDLTPPPVGPEAAADVLQDENCPYKNLERHLRCVDVFTRRCMTSAQRRAFYSLYSVPTLDMQELCTEGGPYRQEYLKHSACLRNVYTEYVECGRRHQSELAALMAEHQQQKSGSDLTSTPFTSPDQITQNLAHLCSSFKGHLKCVNGIVRATCGAETEEFANQFLSQMASSLLNICEKPTNEATDSDVSWSPSENSASKTKAGTAALTISTVIVMAIVSRQR